MTERAGAGEHDCAGCIAHQLRIVVLDESIAGCAQRVASLAAQLAAAQATIARLKAESQVLSLQWVERRDVLVHMLEEANARAADYGKHFDIMVEQRDQAEARVAVLEDGIATIQAQTQEPATERACAALLASPPLPVMRPALDYGVHVGHNLGLESRCAATEAELRDGMCHEPGHWTPPPTPSPEPGG